MGTKLRAQTLCLNIEPQNDGIEFLYNYLYLYSCNLLQIN